MTSPWSGGGPLESDVAPRSDVTPSGTVREARLEDAQSLAALSGALGYPVPADTIARRLARLLRSSHDTVLVAESDPGEVLGWIHGSEQALLEAERRCEILGLIVEGEHRQLGIGRRLVTDVERWASARGLRTMSVRSNVARPDAHPFYERLGYKRIKTQHAYRKRLASDRSQTFGGGDTHDL